MAPHRDNPANRCHQYCAGCCERGPSRPVNLIGAEGVFPLHLLGVMPRKPFLRKTFGHCLSANVYDGARTDFVSSGSQSSSHVFWRHALQSLVPSTVLHCIGRRPFRCLIRETCVAHRGTSPDALYSSDGLVLASFWCCWPRRCHATAPHEPSALPAW